MDIFDEKIIQMKNDISLIGQEIKDIQKVNYLKIYNIIIEKSNKKR